MELNIPEGINYECTGCGKCCSGWSVPLTEEDYQRISSIDWAALNTDLKGKDLFRALKANEKLHTPYSHAIKPEANGQCPFLKDNLCFIHSQLGASFKPAICKLFPYSFNETPTGVFTTVSFISRGAVFNAGRSLIEQREYLKSKYAEFKQLFPDHQPNWSAIKLSSNEVLSWAEYIEIEKHLLDFLGDKNKRIENRFIAGSIYLQSLLAAKLAKNSKLAPDMNAPIVDANFDWNREKKEALNNWDKIIFISLYKKYFPERSKQPAKSYGQLSLDASTFVNGFLCLKQFDSLITETRQISLTNIDEQINDVIYRFFYSRVFAKLYFAAGFGQLSLICGFNHLALILALLKINMKLHAQRASRNEICMNDAERAIVQLEKSLGELKISPYGAAILELLLNSQQRIGRILSLS